MILDKLMSAYRKEIYDAECRSLERIGRVSVNLALLAENVTTVIAALRRVEGAICAARHAYMKYPGMLDHRREHDALRAFFAALTEGDN